MSRAESLQARRTAIIRELAEIEEMRRGSLVEQYIESVKADGTKVRRGPYVLYSYKDKKKTFSRRITDTGQVNAYRKQIDGFRRFQELISEMTKVSEQLSDLRISDPGSKKKQSK